MTDAEKIAALVEALDECGKAISNPTEWEGGLLTHMAEMNGRLAWYEKTTPIRDKARALLAQIKE